MHVMPINNVYHKYCMIIDDLNVISINFCNKFIFYQNSVPDLALLKGKRLLTTIH